MFSKRTILTALVFVGVAASTSLVARADTMDNFTLTGPGKTDIVDITFSLPSSPTPSSYVSKQYFEVDNVVLNVNGMNYTDNLFFYKGGIKGDGGGFAFDFLNLYGKQLYTGTVADPTFKTADFTLYQSESDNSYCDQGKYNLNITATPEPESLLLMGTGLLALLGAAGLKRFA